LAETRVSSEGLAALKELTALKTLYLDKTLVTDEGPIHLKGLSKLRCLGLKDTCVTIKGIAAFRAAMPEVVFVEHWE
jgi:hypothetical protein